MRPFLVLVLVVGAIAALIFGLVNLRSPEDAPPPVVPNQVESDPEPVGPGAPLTGAGGDGGSRSAAPVDPADPRAIANPGAQSQYVYDNVLTGLVRNPQGQPLRDVEVTLTTIGGNDIFFANDPIDRSRDVTVRTDSEGRYTFRRLEPRSHYQLIAVHPDYTRKETTTVPIGQKGTYEEPPIVLSEGATLQGRVRDTQNNYVNDAVLQLEGLMYQAAPYAAPDRLETKTNADGFYVFSNVPKGQRTLTVVAPGYGRVTVNGLTFDKDEAVTRDITLQIGEMIRGRVVGPGNAAIQGATVTAIGFSNTQQTARSQVTTDARGEFLFEDLAPGDYNVIASLKGWRADRAQRVKTNSDNVVIEMSKEATVCGEVVDAATGQPVPSFTIRMRFHYGPDVPSSPSEQTQTFQSAKGDFCIEGVPPSEYVVEAQAPGYAPGFSSNFSVAQGKSVNGITIRVGRGGSISGRIVDPEGKPIAQARITTHDKEWTDDPFTQSLGIAYPTNVTATEARTDSDGRFLLSSLHPETYQIQIQAPGYTSFARSDVSVGDGVETKLGDVKLGRGGTLRGTLYDPAGKGLVGGQIHLRPADGGTPYQYQTKSGVDGKFVIANIVPGRYVVTATRGASGEISPFEQLADIKNSEQQVPITEGAETIQDLKISGE